MTDVRTPRLAYVTSDGRTLDDAIAHYVTSGPGLILFEAVEEACQVLAKRETDRRIVLAIANATKSDAETKAALAVGAVLKRANVSLWALDYTPDASRVSETIRLSEEKARLFTNWTVSAAARRHRHRHDRAAAGATRLARLIASQYAVTYRRPAGTGQVPLRTGVSGDPGEEGLRTDLVRAIGRGREGGSGFDPPTPRGSHPEPRYGWFISALLYLDTIDAGARTVAPGRVTVTSSGFCPKAPGIVNPIRYDDRVSNAIRSSGPARSCSTTTCRLPTGRKAGW